MAFNQKQKDGVYNPNVNRPFWDLAGPAIIQTAFGAAEKYAIWASRYKPRNMIETNYHEWKEMLLRSFLNLSGHLSEAEDDTEWKVMYEELNNHYFGDRPLSDAVLGKRTQDIIRYLKHLGLTTIEVSPIEDSQASLARFPQEDTL